MLGQEAFEDVALKFANGFREAKGKFYRCFFVREIKIQSEVVLSADFRLGEIAVKSLPCGLAETIHERVGRKIASTSALGLEEILSSFGDPLRLLDKPGGLNP